MTLTEQCQKNELPSADENHTWLAYYLEQASGRIHADSYWRGNWGHADRDSIIKVLAPVPSYEEWKSAYECQLMESELVLTLKELLRECQEYIVNTPVYPQGDEWKQKQIHRLLDKIIHAIGEN